MRQVLTAWMGTALLLGMPSAAAAPAYEGEPVIAVDVRGLKAIARETVLAKIQTKPGNPYQDAVVSEDIRRVFALGYFTDVRADVEALPDGLKVVFVAQEKPAIGAIRIEGTRFMQKRKARELLGLQEGELYDPRKVKAGVDQLKAEYARRGFSQCEISWRADADEPQGAATVFLVVDEGPRMRIRQILVEGNLAFPDGQIRKVMKTKRARWFRSGTYDEQVLEEDLERVRAFYEKHGYQDAAVEQTIYRDPAGRGLHVHLQVTEGLQHRVGAVAVDGAVLFPEPEIRRVLTLKPGAVFNTDGLQEDLRRIKEYYGDRGYIHAEVEPDPSLDQRTKRVDLTYHITEHELVYVNRVEIQGNLKTQDVVVRRELRIDPGEPFDGAKIRKSIDRLYNLGYFEEVNVETEPTPQATREDLVFQVKESKTGSFSFGGGFSSVDRLVGLVELEQRNFDWRNVPTFTGAGQDLRLRIEVGTVRRYFDLSFTEPWIFGHPVSFGVDLFNRTRLRSRNLGLAFEEERRGTGLRLGKELADFINVNLNYQLFRTEISDVIDEASSDLKAEQGTSTISEVGVGISADRRDNRFDPTRGWFAFTSGDVAGFWGDREFYRLQGGASGYWSHAGRFVFESRIKAGIVNEYAETAEVPIFERFFGGGSGTIRGYRERRVGPRDATSNDPIGGEATVVGTLEEVMTIMKDERGRAILRGSVFYDVGNVWRRVDEFGSTFKSGIGMGARVNTPIGPVRLDVGYPLSDLQGEKKELRFHFNVSRSF